MGEIGKAVDRSCVYDGGPTVIRVRTAFSFRSAVGKIEDVLQRLIECGYPAAPITDRSSTFGFNKWSKLCAKAGVRPVFGVELGVSESVNAKKPTIDYWTFLAIDSIRPLNKLVNLATEQFRYEPLLTYEQAQAATGVYRIAGRRAVLERMKIDGYTYVALAPGTTRGYARKALQMGFPFAACSDNRYINADDLGFFEVVCGRNASAQTYDQHIQTPDEWRASITGAGLDPELIEDAWNNSQIILNSCQAKLEKAKLLTPEKPLSLSQMCVEGAVKLGCNIADPVYAARLSRELATIADKGFEDYFYIVADITRFARENMIVGPARGSSCGSLVCYLLGITSVDPIPHGLIFERFIDANRNDLPDIDIDFSDQQRHLVFEYVNRKYGSDRVARLGTVAFYKPDSSLNEAGKSLRIPPWEIDKLKETIQKRWTGDSRANDALEDSMLTLPAGQKLLADHPGIWVATRMEGHPRHGGQHAAGIIISERPVLDFVAVDHRTGATMCDKRDAEDLDLLKIDALGLTQLSVFEDALELARLPRDTLENLPLTDRHVFDVINAGKFSGIFQFNGPSLQSLARRLTMTEFNDLVTVTALARPGPLASGASSEWVRRRIGEDTVKYPHPVFEPFLKDTLGIIVYQEQVMEICRSIGDLSWGDVNALRKALSKSFGKEYFDAYGDRWKVGALSHGLTQETADRVWDNLCAYGAYGFNKCIAEGTKVRLAITGFRPDITIDTPIEDLYRVYVEEASPYLRRKMMKGQGPTLISFDGERGRPARAVAIYKNGIKPVYRYIFSDGTEVECTKDHKFWINGKERRIGDAGIGDEFLSLEDDPVPKDPKFRVSVDSDKGKPARGNSYGRANKGFLTGKDNPSWGNGSFAIYRAFVEENRGKPCQKCEKLHSGRFEAHHTDFDSGRTDPNGLEWLCVSCHRKAHYDFDRVVQWGKGKRPTAKVLTSIEFAGNKMTYDIEMPDPNHNFMLSNGLVTHNSHSVAYSFVSYWCLWLKTYHPFEFAAATLTHEANPDRQMELLREMVLEGYEYIPVDRDASTEKWTVTQRGNQKYLVGPLSNVKGVGPKMVNAILGARARNERFPDRAEKLLNNPKTSIDSLFPIADARRRLLPDPAARNIHTPAVKVADIHVGTEGREKVQVLVYGVFTKIVPRDENELVRIQKRNGREIKDGRTAYLNVHLTDDTGTIFCIVNRFGYEDMGREILNRGGAGKHLYAVKGELRGDASFKMIQITNLRWIGAIEEEIKFSESS